MSFAIQFYVQAILTQFQHSIFRRSAFFSEGPLVYFEQQENPFFCGPSSAVIALNAIRSEAETVWTQKSFFCKQATKIKSIAQVCGQSLSRGRMSLGLELAQLEQMIRLKGVQVELTYAEEARREEMKRHLKSSLLQKKAFVILNYYRPRIGQSGGGHFSPLAGYDAETDSFLILDVNPLIHAPIWVRADRLLDSLITSDRGVPRGYLLVRRPQ